MANNAAEQSIKQWEASVGDSKQGDGQMQEHMSYYIFARLKFDLHKPENSYAFFDLFEES